MTGKELRIKLKQMGYELTHIASKLGISPQSLNSKLNAENLKMSFIEEVANSINETVYHLLAGLPIISKSTTDTIQSFTDLIHSMQIDIEQLKQEVKELKTEIHHLKSSI